MTILELELCLHYAVGVGDHAWLYSDAPIVDEIFDGLVKKGILTKTKGFPKRRYDPTDKLRYFTEMLKNTPLPVGLEAAPWRDPRSTN
jgi:hypothetical protein